jgi:hypothetical protein
MWVYFPDIPGSTDDAVKKLAVENCQLIETPKLSDPRLTHVPASL